MSKSKKKQKPGKAKKIFVTLLCLIVLAVLGLSIAGNVLLYNKVTDLTAALDKGEEPSEQFKPLDSSTPVSLRAGDNGQHLYINTDKAVWDAYKSSGKVISFALKNPYSYNGDENYLNEIFSGTGDFAFGIFVDASAIAIQFGDNKFITVYSFRTQEFGPDLIVSENGQMSFDDSVFEEFGFDTVYLYPALAIIPEDFEGDVDRNILCSVEEIDKLFAFSPFGNQQ